MRRKRTPDSQPSVLAGPQTGAARKRMNFVIPAAAIAAVVVGGVSGGAYYMNPGGRGADSLSQAIDSLPRSSSVALLEQERQRIIVMNAAMSTMTTSKPATVLPAKVMAAMAASESSSSSSGSSSSSSPGSSSSSSSSSSPAETMLPVDPARDQATAQSLMPGFGFSVSSQWSCLDDLWNQESSWNYTAVNAQSGAYGIAQALPPGQMDTVASDWATNPVTQIKWGLGYVQSRYSTPCGAWAHEEADGWY